MIIETRIVTFKEDALQEALQVYQSKFPEKFPEGALQGARVTRTHPPTVVVEVESASGRRQLSRVEFREAEIAAILIHYCRTHRIPLPRAASKRLDVEEGNICLILTKALQPPLAHLAPLVPLAPEGEPAAS